MPIKIYKKEEQAYGEFNGGEIVENKPIGFPQDGSRLKPYSNLFYWANAYSEKSSLIGEHPHKGFEIMSVVLEGSIEHYDSKNKAWKSLEKGDVQLMKTGSGISHAERMGEQARIFQIWFDPDLSATLQIVPEYFDYKQTEFPAEEHDGVNILTIVGPGSPIDMDTQGINISKYEISTDSFKFPIKNDSYYSVYILSGQPEINGKNTEKDDFVIISEEEVFSINKANTSLLFIIESPMKLNYKTYRELFS